MFFFGYYFPLKSVVLLTVPTSTETVQRSLSCLRPGPEGNHRSGGSLAPKQPVETPKMQDCVGESDGSVKEFKNPTSSFTSRC